MADLPEFDPTKSKKEQGLYRKFEVRRTDGKDAPGEKHHGCEYFVLDATHDPAAIPALIAYAKYVGANGYPQLAEDIGKRIDAITQGKKDHSSDCATHNEPAMPNGDCDCGAE